MKELGNCPTGDAIREMAQKRQMLHDETVPVLFLSTALLVAATQILSELDDDSELGMVLLVSDDDALNLEIGTTQRSEIRTLDEMPNHLERFLSLNVEHDVLPDLVFEKIPYWKQVNNHPQGPGPGQRKGGKDHRHQKHKR